MESTSSETKKKNNLVFLNAESDDVLRICTELLEEVKNGKVGDLLLLYFNKNDVAKEARECDKDECKGKDYMTVYWSVKNIIKMVGLIEKVKFDILTQSAYEDYMEGGE